MRLPEEIIKEENPSLEDVLAAVNEPQVVENPIRFQPAGQGTGLRDPKTGRFLTKDGKTGVGKYRKGPASIGKQTIDAIARSFPPEVVVSLLAEGVEMARNTNSPRSMLEFVELIMSYTVGKPVTRSVSFTSKFEKGLLNLLDMAPEDDEYDQYHEIEGEAEVIDGNG